MIGLVGGLGPAATVHYYRELVGEAARRRVDLRLVITHADVARVLDFAARDDRVALTAYLSARCAELEVAGADILAIGAVTPHLCRRELAATLRTPLIDLVDVVAVEVERRGIKRPLLLGTRKVMESRLFGRLAAGPPALDPDDLQRVHDLYVTIVHAGGVSEPVANELRRVASELVARERPDAIVLAGTELSLAPPETWPDVPVLDAAGAHICAIMDAC